MTLRIKVDYTKQLSGEPNVGHNRWHPDIQPILELEPGEEVGIETRDAFDSQLSPASTLDDIPSLDLNLVHPLTGPVYVKGAQPGDLLQIDILEVTTGDWGYTIQVPGFGFLRDVFPDPFIAHWNLKGDHAESPQIPGVRIPSGAFIGIMGLAPSEELRQQMFLREEELRNRGGFVLPPGAEGAVPSQGVASVQGLRTIPPRENGGNMDIKQLTPGARLLMPVFVDGALFSAGDAHYAQGDGEVCGTAIETNGSLLAKFTIHKGEAARKNIRFPRLERDDFFLPPEWAAPKRFVATTGFPLHDDDKNEAEDVTLAARHAVLNMIDLLQERGYSAREAYTICSVAVDLKISELVDVPNVVVSAFLPLDIFNT